MSARHKRLQRGKADVLELYSVKSFDNPSLPATVQRRHTRFEADDSSGRIATTNSYHQATVPLRNGSGRPPDISWKSTPDDPPSFEALDPDYVDFIASITLDHEPRRRTQAVS